MTSPAGPHVMPPAAPDRTPGRRRWTLVAIAATVAGLLVVTAGTASAAGPARRPATTSNATDLPTLDPAALDAAVAGLPDAAATSAQVKVTGPAGRWSGTSGVGDVVSGGTTASSARTPGWRASARAGSCG